METQKTHRIQQVFRYMNNYWLWQWSLYLFFFFLPHRTNFLNGLFSGVTYMSNCSQQIPVYKLICVITYGYSKEIASLKTCFKIFLFTVQIHILLTITVADCHDYKIFLIFFLACQLTENTLQRKRCCCCLLIHDLSSKHQEKISPTQTCVCADVTN